MKHYITCESVTKGHPDKLCDQVSDAILDACLIQDPLSRVACEAFTTTDIVIVGGEITTNAIVDYESLIRKTVCEIGFDSDIKHFNGNECAVLNLIHKQSPDIAQGVDTGGAGDQGIMYGYATNETASLLPLPIDLAHKLAKRLTQIRENGTLSYLYPDGKTQVTVEYDNKKALRVDAVVVSSQHALDIQHNQIIQGITEHVIKPVLGDLLDEQTRIFINPTGIFNIGGPKGDTGLTGRKIIVDTYGGIGRHGGGAFSGKDATKVDRSGAYIARYLAKNIVASGVCDECEVQLGYAIGVVQPVSVYVNCFGTEKVDLQKIVDVVSQHFDLSPKGIIGKLDLRKPIFKHTAVHGHFGRDEFTREKTDSVDVFKKLL